MITPSFNLTATERVLPKLALDFTTATLDPRVTFTRSANTATIVNSSGFVERVNADVPRFYFDSLTLACKGLLIEESRTNSMPYSENFSQWNQSNVSVSSNISTIIAPDNTTNADKTIEALDVNQRHRIQLNITSAAASTVYTGSIFLKAAERFNAIIYLADGGGLTNTARLNLVNLQTGTLGSVTSTGTFSNVSATVTPFKNNWYRVTLTATIPASTNLFLQCFLANNTGARDYDGDGTSGLYMFGAQLEVGAFATSYIPTEATALTRNADVATMMGTNFSDFWQASKGGTSVLATPSTVSGIRPLVQFDDNTANEIIALRGNTTNPELYIVDGGTPQAQLDAGTIAANTAYSLTGWWDTNDCKARKDAGAVVTDTTATIPTVTQMRIGSDGTNYLNGTIATINYYDSFFGQPIYTRRKNKVFPSLL